MNIRLDGKSALITGSTSGIGWATARGLAAAGASVYLHGRTAARVEAAMTRLRAELPEAQLGGVAADLESAAGADHLGAQIPDVDILVNNAAIYAPGNFFQLSDQDWRRTLEINLLAAIRLARHYVPRMVQREWGRVIFVSSDSGVQIPKEWVDYGVAKAALMAAARGLAETVAHSGVTVNSVVPGPTLTETVETYLTKFGDPNQTKAERAQTYLAEARPSSLLGRFATPEEVGNLITYLVSSQASATTGATLRVDGGVVRTIL